MKNPTSWAVVAALICVILSTVADTMSTQYWKRQSGALLLSLFIISPCVFVAFGYVGHNFGLSIASCLTNSFIVICPILIGLIFFSEWKQMTIPVYIGMAMIVIGITLIVIYKKETG